MMVMMMRVTMEEIASEMSEHEKRNGEGGLPPGFRFHPTDQELITFYLASKVFNNNNSCSNHHLNFVEVDLNRCEPWELPEGAKMGEREWYLYSVRDRKYPTGLRTNRATAAGYWKATGKDKQVYGGGGGGVVGMKKTLVFYKGRAPRGQKTKWVMHEFRLDPHTSPSSSLSKDEWVICRIFHKSGEKRSATPFLQQQQDHPLLFQTPSSSSLINLHNTNHSHNHNLFSPLLHPVFPTPAVEPNKNRSSSSIMMNNHNNYPPPPPPSSQNMLKLKNSTNKLTKTQPPPTFQYQHQQQLPDDPNFLLHWIESSNNNNNCNHIMDAAAAAGLIGPSPTANAEIIRDIIMSSSPASMLLNDGLQSWLHHHHL